ncbi:MAG: hypothetical protein GY755_14910, partial [Chloroflexi bacterium]|nr:hypothetical protein [Chloroflexota bacterium]
REGSCNEHHQQDTSKTSPSNPEIAEQNNAAAATSAASLMNENVANHQSSTTNCAVPAPQRRFGKLRLHRHGSCLATGKEDLRKDVGSVCESLNPTKTRKVAAASPMSAALEQQRPSPTAVAATASVSVAESTKAVSGKKRSSEKKIVGEVNKNKNQNKKRTSSSFCSFKKSHSLKKSTLSKNPKTKNKNTLNNFNLINFNGNLLNFLTRGLRANDVSSRSWTEETLPDRGSTPGM